LVNNTNTVQFVTYTVIPKASAGLGGCLGDAQTVTVTVNPKPNMTSATSKTICSGESVAIALTSDVPSNYSWIATNNANIIGESLTAQNSGTLSDILTNTTNVAQTVTYSVTPTSTTGGCIGTPQTVTVTVNPKPVLTTPLTKTICSGDVLNIALISSVTSTYSWIATDNANISGESLVAQTTSTINNTLINNSPNVQTVNYTIASTSTSGGCIGDAKTLVVTVNPAPVLTSSPTPSAICSGSTFSYVPTSSTPNPVTFAWTRAVVGGISNGPGSNNGNPNEILFNTTTAPIPVTYIFTLTANGCTNPITFPVTVIVNPIPTLKPSFAKEPFLANAPKTDININHKVKIPYFDRLK
jgi:hypothetical protein